MSMLVLRDLSICMPISISISMRDKCAWLCKAEVCKQMVISCRQEMYGVHVLVQFFDWGGYDMKDLRNEI